MSALQPREGIVFQTTEHGAVLLDVTTGQFYGLNHVAAVAWTALARAGTTEDAVAAILDRFDIDEPVARTDVNGLITALCSRGLLSSTP
ncbi:MAG: PqqD family protein [Pseudonocardiaceae bacterium]